MLPRTLSRTPSRTPSLHAFSITPSTGSYSPPLTAHPSVRPWQSGRLWCGAVYLSVRRRTWNCICRSLGQHEPGATEDWRVIRIFLLTGLPSLALLIVFPQSLDGRCLLTHEADHKRHGEVVKTMAP